MVPSKEKGSVSLSKNLVLQEGTAAIFYISKELRIIKSNIVYSNKITNIEFRNWYYIINKIILYPYSPIYNIYINTGYSIIVIDRKFIEANLLYTKIRTMALLAIIKGLEKAKY